MKLKVLLSVSALAVIMSFAALAETLTPFDSHADMGMDSSGVMYTLDAASETAFVGGAEQMYNTSMYDGANDGYIIIPDTVEMNGLSYEVTEIEPFAFANNEKLVGIGIGKNISVIGASAFAGCSQLDIVETDVLNTTFMVGECGVYSHDGKSLIFYFDSSKKASFRVPDGVESIAAGAFEGCTGLTYLDLNNVTQVGAFAFANSRIKTCECNGTVIKSGTFADSRIEVVAVMGDSLTEICDGAFMGCADLKTLILPQTSNIGHDAFSGCTSLETLIFCSPEIITLSQDSFSGLPDNCRIICNSGNTAFDPFSDKLSICPVTTIGRVWNSVRGNISANTAFGYVKDGTGKIVLTAKNSTMLDKSITAYVAFYSDARLVDVAIMPLDFSPCETKSLEVQTSQGFSSYAVILLNGNMKPGGAALVK